MARSSTFFNSNPNCEDMRGKYFSHTHLLQIEDVVVKVILQLFICIIDAELLKAVCLKVLKAKNIQDSDGQTLENKSMNSGTLMKNRRT